MSATTTPSGRRGAAWSAKRKEVRELMRPYARSSYLRGLWAVLFDFVLWAIALTVVVQAHSVVAKLAAGLVLGWIISRLFILGHDAAHQSLTPSRVLNGVVGRVLFLPTLCPFSIWVAGHNVAHHGFAGLRRRDIPWVPLSPEQYRALTHAERWVYRIYRAWWGAGLYYAVSVWWPKQIFPPGKVRRVFTWDSWLVTAFMALQISAFLLAAALTDQSPWLLLGCGIVLPLITWFYIAAFVFFVHHTDLDARWYDDEVTWRAVQPELSGTRSTRLPLHADVLLHAVLEHTAHHMNAKIPSYRLAAAQRKLETRYPEEVQRHRLTLRGYIKATKRCQLYDGIQHRWFSCAEVEKMPMTVQSAPAMATRRRSAA